MAGRYVAPLGIMLPKLSATGTLGGHPPPNTSESFVVLLRAVLFRGGRRARSARAGSWRELHDEDESETTESSSIRTQHLGRGVLRLSG